MSDRAIVRIDASTQSFDYTCVEIKVKNCLRGEAESIRRSCITSMIEIGKSLLRAKHYLHHGQFLKWVELEAGIAGRTAQAYMRVAQWASNKSAAVEQLPPTVLYTLSAPSAPREFVTKILEKIERGESIPSIAAMKREIASLRKRRAEEKLKQQASNGTDSQAGGSSRVLEEIIELVSFRLSSQEFQRFCDLMTSKHIIDDSNLRRTILLSFGNFKMAYSPDEAMASSSPPAPHEDRHLECDEDRKMAAAEMLAPPDTGRGCIPQLA